jgi:hypothetical protein
MHRCLPEPCGSFTEEWPGTKGFPEAFFCGFPAFRLAYRSCIDYNMRIIPLGH